MSSRKRAALLGAMFLISGHRALAASLFDDLGQKPGIEQLIKQTVSIWTKDPRVSEVFDDVNLVRLQRMLVDQVCALSGGNCQYNGRSMAEAHKGLHLANRQFNAVAEDMQTAMEQLGYPYPVQNRLIALLAPMQRDVVTR